MFFACVALHRSYSVDTLISSRASPGRPPRRMQMKLSRCDKTENRSVHVAVNRHSYPVYICYPHSLTLSHSHNDRSSFTSLLSSHFYSSDFHVRILAVFLSVIMRGYIFDGILYDSLFFLSSIKPSFCFIPIFRYAFSVCIQIRETFLSWSIPHLC